MLLPNKVVTSVNPKLIPVILTSLKNFLLDVDDFFNVCVGLNCLVNQKPKRFIEVILNQKEFKKTFQVWIKSISA